MRENEMYTGQSHDHVSARLKQSWRHSGIAKGRHGQTVLEYLKCYELPYGNESICDEETGRVGICDLWLSARGFVPC